MSKAEQRFKRWLIEAYPGAYIKKIPDFKQTASGLLRGLPDYLVMWHGASIWYEVKYTKSLRTLNFKAFTEPQMVEFKKMLAQGGVDVYIGVYNGAYKLAIISFSEVLKALEKGEKTYIL